MTGGTLAGSLSTGSGDDHATFRGLTDANLIGATRLGGDGIATGADTLTFDETRSTGTRRLTGWNRIALVNGSTLTSDGDLVAGGTVSIDPTSTLYAGNGVNGAIRAEAGGALTLVNAGTIDLTNGSSGAGDTLTVRGDYVGQGGTLMLDTVLGASGSLSDRLVIDGGTVSGSTAIRVMNAGGLGAATVGNGIEVVAAINGGRTTATTSGSGFTLAGGHVDAGAYEYRLYASDPAGSESFYLRTAAAAVPTDPDDPSESIPSDEPITYRVEVPLLAALPAQLRTGDLAMLGTYHQRIGDRTGDAGDGFAIPGRIWGRFVADNVHRRQGGDARPSTDSHGRGFQLGIDLFTFGKPGGEHHVGIFGGYLHDRARVDGFAGGVERSYAGRLNPRTAYAGGYWTYLARTGFYVDTVIQRSWYGGHALAANGDRIGIDGVGILASVETGWALALSPIWKLEPQAQIIAQGISIHDAAIPDAIVRQRSPGYLTGRLGARLVGSFGSSAGTIQPYVRANLWKGFRSTDRTAFATASANTVIRTRTSSLLGEGGGGVTWPIARAVVLYGEADYRFTLARDQGETGNATTGSVGARLRF